MDRTTRERLHHLRVEGIMRDLNSALQQAEYARERAEGTEPYDAATEMIEAILRAIHAVENYDAVSA